MPLPVAHGLLGATIIAAAHPRPTSRYLLPFGIGIFLANAADADFLLVSVFHSREWHRGFSHSIMVALVVALGLVLSLGRQRIQEAAVYGLAYASHGILDFATTKDGRGVELLWPFSSARLGLRWFGLSELPSLLPPLGIMKALALEFVLFAPLFVLTMFLRSRRLKRAERR